MALDSSADLSTSISPVTTRFEAKREQLIAEPASSYAYKARSAVLWNTGFNFFRDLLQFVQMLVLARILSPADYGMFNLVTSIVGFLAIFSATNFLAFTLHVDSDDETHFQDQFTASAILQLNVFVVANLIALFLARSQDYAKVAPLLHVMSLTFLLEWSCELRRKMLERQLDWKSLRTLQAAGLVMSVIVAILMAWMGAGAYALVFPGMLVTAPFIYDLFVKQGWRPTWQLSWKNYRSSFRFGLSRVGAGIAVAGRQLLESSMLAAIIGFGPLGMVNRAVGVSQLACGKIATQLMYSIYPILPRLDLQTGQARTAGNLILRIVGWTIIPLGVCLSVLAVPVIRTVYGEKWLTAAPMLKWTLGWVVTSSLLQIAYSLSLARRMIRLCLALDIAALVTTALCLRLLLVHGVIVYIAGLIVSYQVSLWVTIVALVRKEALSYRGVLLAFGPPIVASTFLLIIASIVSTALRFCPDHFWSAAAWGTLFFLGYVAFIRVAFVAALSEMTAYLPFKAAIHRILRIAINQHSL
jgi:O-antigen/teichoic acid export membrane protein